MLPSKHSLDVTAFPRHQSPMVNTALPERIPGG